MSLHLFVISKGTIVIDKLMQVLPYIALGVTAGILGGLVATFWKPSLRVRSGLQHFAAGVVIAAIAAEVVPELEVIGAPWRTIAGFIGGGLFMILLKWVVLRFEEQQSQKGRRSIGIAAAAGLDTAVDGMLIGAGFSTGQQVGTLLAFALSVELFFLTLSVGTEYSSGGRSHLGRRGKHADGDRETQEDAGIQLGSKWRGFAITTGITAMLAVGAVAALWVLSDAAEETVALALAFGAAALIYLVAEELLVEAIEAEESLWSTAALFAGFLVLFSAILLFGGGPAAG